ncbi:ankyrin repeat-containing protein NPR4-like [Carica papaya]|uniref:ankyrin repeat-containing protein NPR4-like n=1 Tax=Carica papaya TaxID=3649 RepID=UPI000B8D058D|nr:ankyrin repeat-containing protein NPR4-like [Carica papaya]
MSAANGASRVLPQPVHVVSSPLVSVVHSGEIRVFGLTRHAPLYLAALKGDWKTAEAYLFRNPEAASAKITRGLETALHIAAGARHTKFVENLVRKMTQSDLAEKNRAGNTALCFAVASGVKEIAEAMVKKNANLPFIRGNQDATPLYMATLLGHKDMVWYLYSITHEYINDEQRIQLLVAAITSDLFDVALDIIRRHPDTAIATDEKGETALHALARKPSVFNSKTQLGIWKRFIYPYLYVELPKNPHSSSTAPRQSTTNSSVTRYMKIIFTRVIKFLVPGTKSIYKTKLMHSQALELTKELWRFVLLEDETYVQELIRSPSRLLFTAAELGIVEFIVILIRSYPDLIWKVDDKNRSIFHIAVMHRQEMIFSLIYEIGGLKDLIAAYKDADGNNMLHFAGKLPPLDRAKADSSAALQLRKELRWFKEVEKIVQPSFKDMVNKEGKTPQTIFAEEHKCLVTEGEKWMRNTASSCMVVATLIATVMFAAAFTVPGENDETGVANHLTEKSFLVFIISDSLSLFSSSMSILMFLSILTSRYAQEDFLDSLPNKLDLASEKMIGSAMKDSGLYLLPVTTFFSNGQTLSTK